MSNISLRDLYKSKIIAEITKELDIKNTMLVPKLDKIVINMGLGKSALDKKILDEGVVELEKMTGQKPVVTIARKSLANFKLREGMPIGTKITLRNDNMYIFLEKLIKLALPRVRDFRGVPKNSFDGQGNYTLGIKEHIIFPEIDFDKVKFMKGMDISIIFKSDNTDANRLLLEKFGFPFKK